MKKIAFFMHNFNGGGAEKVTITLANNLANRGHIVSIIVKDNIGILKDTIESKVEIENLDIQSKSKSKIIKNIINIKYLKQIIEEQRFDVMISVTSPMNLVAAISNALSKNKIKLYATVHSMISKERKSFNIVRHKLLKYFDKYITKTIVVSREAEQDYIETIGVDEKKTTTIYNPVVSNKLFDLQNKDINHKWLNSNREYKTILAVGRLTEAKNYEMLLRAISIVKQILDIRLIILGEGELEQHLKELSKKLEIDNIVDFYGFINNPYPYFKKCDLYTLTSNWEGLPSVLIEAMACGCNIVSTECPSGPKEILQNGKYGKLTPVNDVEKLAYAIREALESKIDKISQVERAREFSIDNSIKNYLELICEY